MVSQYLIKDVSGDIGNTKAGTNKQITWVPEKDAIFLDEEVNFYFDSWPIASD